MAVPVFPSLPGLGWPVKRSVQWDTVKNDALSGKKTRFGNWTYPLYRYEITLNVLRSGAQQEWQTLEGFVNSVQGAAQLWAFDDPNDDTVTTQSFGQGDGVSTAFQLVRTLGGFAGPVFLVNGTPQIFVAGVLTAPASVSAYGVVNFSSPPANGASLTWTGQFYQPCRFDDDATDIEAFMLQFLRAQKLNFSTEKLP